MNFSKLSGEILKHGSRSNRIRFILVNVEQVDTSIVTNYIVDLNGLAIFVFHILEFNLNKFTISKSCRRDTIISLD